MKMIIIETNKMINSGMNGQWWVCTLSLLSGVFLVRQFQNVKTDFCEQVTIGDDLVISPIILVKTHLIFNLFSQRDLKLS
jgi:hypothetical protein